MMRTTHQVAAFAAGLGALAVAQSVTGDPLVGVDPSAVPAVSIFSVRTPFVATSYTWPVAVLYVLAAVLGGIAPDLDRSEGFWARILSATILGGHRHLSHSLLGAGLVAILFWIAMIAIGPILAFPAGLLWMGFMSGYLSHLVVDGLTHDGVPLLFPWRFNFGFPPLEALRIHTGGWAEQFVVLPGLLVSIAWLGFTHGQLLASLWG